MNKYVVYKYKAGISSGNFYVLTIDEAFVLIGSKGTDLPTLKGHSDPVNQIDIEQILGSLELIRLTYKGEDWIITKVWE